ncbi:hypothetical protein GCM10009863_17000 [Streptomyces axinellae]|uniref:HTH luxR-type domain-containing protein n=1 Tax=Streptomyces axinellae TaxID=552788 RepID=A0ABN3PVA7_9ACTN
MRPAAAGALRALARTTPPAEPAADPQRPPLTEALQGLGALAPAPAATPAPERPAARATSAGGPRAVPLPLAGVSPAESRVAALAAAGYCNREIARRLFITVSTVEQHLTKAYRKLGVASRADLPAPSWRCVEPSEPTASYGWGPAARGNGGLS